VLIRPLLVDIVVEPARLAESSAIRDYTDATLNSFFSSFCTSFFGLDLLSLTLVLHLMVSCRGHRNDTDGEQMGGTFIHQHLF
jgi:hypothetical protein